MHFTKGREAKGVDTLTDQPAIRLPNETIEGVA